LDKERDDLTEVDDDEAVVGIQVGTDAWNNICQLAFVLTKV